MSESKEAYETRYNSLDNEALNDEYTLLRRRLRDNPLDIDTVVRIRFIDTLWGDSDRNGVTKLQRRDPNEGSQMETDFGGESDIRTKLKHDQAVSMVTRFTKERLKVNINWSLDESVDLNNKISLSSNGHVRFARMGDNGVLAIPEIVLKVKNGVLDYNDATSEPIKKAVKAYKEIIGIVAARSREVEAGVENAPMITDIRAFDEGPTSGGGAATGGSQLPPGVYDRMSDNDQREIDGVLSIELSRSAKMYDRERHLRIEIDKWEVKRKRALEDVGWEPDEGEATKLYQKVSDCDAVIKAIKDRIELEKTYGEQVEDVARLQRLKKWLKENWVGLSAIGITVASIVTTIIIGMRTVITKGAQGVSSFAKAVKDAIAKLGPWAAGLANLVYTILKAGASAISFLARNLWIIVIAVSYFLWEMYRAQATDKERKTERTRGVKKK